MTLLDLIANCDDRGIRLSIANAGGLTIDAPRDAVTTELLDLIKQHKPELLRLLAQHEHDHADDWREFITDDRQGIERPNAPLRIKSESQPQRRQPLPAESSGDWPGPLTDFVLLLTAEDLPTAPFSPRPAAIVTDAGKYLAALQADIRRGPSGPRARYGALQADLRRLRDLLDRELT